MSPIIKNFLKDLSEKEKGVMVSKSFKCDWDLWLVKVWKKVFGKKK